LLVASLTKQSRHPQQWKYLTSSQAVFPLIPHCIKHMLPQ